MLPNFSDTEIDIGQKRKLIPSIKMTLYFMGNTSYVWIDFQNYLFFYCFFFFIIIIIQINRIVLFLLKIFVDVCVNVL